MNEWRDLLAPPTMPISEAMQLLGEGAKQILIVVNAEGRLLGSVTDGDIRRGVLNLVAVDEPVSRIMNPSPITAQEHEEPRDTFNRLTGAHVKFVPIVAENGEVVDLLPVAPDLGDTKSQDNWVVLMAGGLGQRLRPLTETVPKPMLSVGEKPLLETIIEQFVKHNFYRFYISINYRADVLKEFFETGNKWDVEIRYLEESKKCGTAGALGLITEQHNEPLIVMNADLLTRVNLTQLLEYHYESGSKATMCVREYDFEVPYGVVEIKKNEIFEINEKPVHRFFVNAGIYVLEPELLKLIEPDVYLDMPKFFEQLNSTGLKTSAFPITEYWLDIGRLNDYERANQEFKDQFK